MAIKVQALADFIAEFTYNVVPDPKTEILEEQKVEDSDITRWKLFMDGSSNQHGYGTDLVLQTHSREQIAYAIRIGFKATTNMAEYEALLAELRVAMELEVESLDAYRDFQIVVNQVRGDYLTEDLRMLAYLDEVKVIAMKIKDFRIHQILWEENKQANALANLASAIDFI